MNFSDITMSKSSAVGIGSSIYLNFTFPELSQKDEDEEILAAQQQQQQQQHSTEPPKPAATTTISMYAIPVIDGVLIENEGTLARVINSKLSSIASQEGFTVGLINDFQVPLVEQQSAKYPMYTQTLKFKRFAGKDEDDYGDEAQDEDAEMSNEDDEENLSKEDSQSGMDSDQKKSQDNSQASGDSDMDGLSPDEKPKKQKKPLKKIPIKTQ